MSARTFYEDVLTATRGIAGLGTDFVSEDDQSLLTGQFPPTYAAVVREVEGDHKPLEIGSGDDTGSFRVPVDFYVKADQPRHDVKDFFDRATTALRPSALISNSRPVVHTIRLPRASHAASPEIEVADYIRLRLIPSTDEL